MKKICVKDWYPLFKKATTIGQVRAIFDALDTCFVEDRSTVKDFEWPELTRVVSEASSRVNQTT